MSRPSIDFTGQIYNLRQSAYVCNRCRLSLLRSAPLVPAAKVWDGLAPRRATKGSTVNKQYRHYSSTAQRYNAEPNKRTSYQAASGTSESGENGRAAEADGIQRGLSPRWDGDIRVQRTAQRLRRMVRSGRLQGDDLRQVLSTTSKRQPKIGPVLPRDTTAATQKLEHSLAATAALAKFRLLPTYEKRNNQKILQELIYEDERHVERNEEAVRTPKSSQEPPTPNLLEHLFNNKPPVNSIESRTLDLGDLALPPILNPAMEKARKLLMNEAKASRRHVRDMSDFELQLHRNPFAHVLASEIRQCAITGMRLPSAMLTKFKTQMNTQTGQPWLVPDGLGPSKLESAFAEELDGGELDPFSLKDAASLSHDNWTSRGEDPVDITSATTPSATDFHINRSADTDASAPISESDNKIPRAVPMSSSAIYVTQNRQALDWLAENSALKQRWVSQRWRQELGASLHRMIIRKNMSGYVQSLLLHKLVRQLAWLNSEHGAPTIRPLQYDVLSCHPSNPNSEVWLSTPDGDIGTDLSSAAAVLYFGRAIKKAELYEKHDQTHGLRSLKRVPFYNIRDLTDKRQFDWLSSAGERVSETSSSDNMFGHKAVVINCDSKAIKVLNLLWQTRSTSNPPRDILLPARRQIGSIEDGVVPTSTNVDDFVK